MKWYNTYVAEKIVDLLHNTEHFVRSQLLQVQYLNLAQTLHHSTVGEVSVPGNLHTVKNGSLL